jgi:hypothetical protein
MAESGEISIALTPVQLFAILNGKSISQAELASNSWHEMPGPPRGADLQRFMQPLSTAEMTADIRQYLAGSAGSGSSSVRATAYSDTAPASRQSAWSQQSHYSQPNPPGCWIPPAARSLPPSTVNRLVAGLEIVGGGLETAGGVLLLLTPEPTMLTKALGGVMTVHGADFTQAAIRQLFSGKRVEDFTEQGATWAARHAGASPKTARRIGVVLDVTVGLGDTIVGATRLVAIRMGRIILSEEAVAGKMGRISLDVEEADKAIGKEGGHTLKKHVNMSDQELENRAIATKDVDAVSSKFFSKAIAEDAINDALKLHKYGIQRWAANPATRTQEFEMECGKAIGKGFVNATGKFETFTKVRVVFKIGRQPGKTIFIVSSYPIP